MTTKMPPGSPKLEWNGQESGEGDTLSDSSWDDLPEDQGKAKQDNLRKIAKSQRKESK